MKKENETMIGTLNITNVKLTLELKSSKNTLPVVLQEGG